MGVALPPRAFLPLTLPPWADAPRARFPAGGRSLPPIPSDKLLESSSAISSSSLEPSSLLCKNRKVILNLNASRQTLTKVQHDSTSAMLLATKVTSRHLMIARHVNLASASWVKLPSVKRRLSRFINWYDDSEQEVRWSVSRQSKLGAQRRLCLEENTGYSMVGCMFTHD